MTLSDEPYLDRADLTVADVFAIAYILNDVPADVRLAARQAFDDRKAEYRKIAENEVEW